jgi:NAD-dependent dihydropyrimidine dehydrogenase PreA subunit
MVPGHGPGSTIGPVTHVIAEPCVDVLDRSCVEECPVDCIYEGLRMLYIHPDECVDCGACEPVCPVEAIYYEDDVPEQWSVVHPANAEFFDRSDPREVRPSSAGSTATWGGRADPAADRRNRARRRCP